MATVDFRYTMRDDMDSYERIEAIESTLSEPVSLTFEELGNLIGRPFNEVQLNCTLDLETGKVTINSAEEI